jgi:hypothetical protein
MTTTPYRHANYMRRKTRTVLPPGRPRTRPDTPAQQRRRHRALTRYYANKNQSGEMR